MANLHNKYADNLFKAVLELENIEECYEFFEDLCTIKEIQGMSQRLEVARLLDEGHIFTDICKETGASSATISRVNKCLVYGSGGYREILDRLKEEED